MRAIILILIRCLILQVKTDRFRQEETDSK